MVMNTTIIVMTKATLEKQIARPSKNAYTVVQCMRLIAAQHLEGKYTRCRDGYHSGKVCRRSSRLVPKEIKSKRYRTFNEMCQHSHESEVSAKVFIMVR